jgi:zinc protease
VPQVLSNVASGLGGRLFEELRGRRSLAYTVAAYPLTRWLAGAFVCYIATSPERETEAREGLLEQLQHFVDDPVYEEELARAQRYTVGAWKIRGQTNSARLADLAEALLVGQGLRDIREFEDRIRDVTPQRLRDWAEATFDPARVIAGVVRGTGGGR